MSVNAKNQGKERHAHALGYIVLHLLLTYPVHLSLLNSRTLSTVLEFQEGTLCCQKGGQHGPPASGQSGHDGLTPDTQKGSGPDLDNYISTLETLILTKPNEINSGVMTQPFHEAIKEILYQ